VRPADDGPAPAADARRGPLRRRPPGDHLSLRGDQRRDRRRPVREDGEGGPDVVSGPEGQPFPELGCYGLAGHSDSPADLIEEVRLAEGLGIGSVFLSERFNVKDAAVLAGAAVAASTRIGIGTAATNHTTRHPIVTATMATTAHRMSGGRYAFGLGRGFDQLFDVMGLPRITSAQIADAVGIYRRLWHGEMVLGHDGPA